MNYIAHELMIISTFKELCILFIDPEYIYPGVHRSSQFDFGPYWLVCFGLAIHCRVMYALSNTIISATIRWQYKMLELQRELYIILFDYIGLVVVELIHGTSCMVIQQLPSTLHV